jgi:hypothetical protein
MSEKLDAAVANQLVRTAMHNVRLPRGNAVLCTKRQLEAAMLRLAQEAYTAGFLLGQKEQFHLLGPGQRPAWMDIRLDDPPDLAKHNIRLRPIVLRSLIGAGYRCLGDLCWVPDHELRKLFYVGRATTRQLRNIIRQFQTRPLEGGHDS